MNYKLCLGEGIKNYSEINIADFFETKKDSYNLEKIDKFTSVFDNEEELKAYLLNKGLICDSDLSKSVGIYYGDKYVKRVPVIYSDDKETVDKIKELSREIKSYFEQKKVEAYSTFSYSLIMGEYLSIQNYFKCFEVMARNHNFLKALQNHVSNNPKQNLNINDISVYLNNFSGDSKSKVIYIALFETFRRTFYKYDKENAELIFNYKGFRDFCVFYCNYKKTHVKDNNSFQKKLQK